MNDIGELADKLKPGMVAVVGVPLDENSSFMCGAALAPPRIREALHSGEANLTAESGIDLSSAAGWLDVGDLALASDMAAFTQIETAIASLLERQVCTLSLGGDHSITYPIVRAYAARYGRLNILQLDAHPDLYDEFEGNRVSHACPFARIMEEDLVARLVQVGIRSMNAHQREQAARFGVEVVEMRDWRPGYSLEFDGPLYLSLDMDAFDPAFAPGVSHHEPGGLSVRDVIQIIHSLEAPLVGADIVEFNPERDLMGITAMVAAKLLKELVASMIKANEAIEP